jgi:hypothetical protein
MKGHATGEGIGATGGTGDVGGIADLRRHVGDLSQVASTREVRLRDGNEDGLRAVDVRVSGGLSALVLADRGMDIGPAWAAGHQLSWQSATGIVHPAYFDERAWLRSFHGGLLVTCGLQNVGPPNVDGGVEHGLHGRVSHIPAREVSHRVVHEDGRLVAEVRGEMRETDVYGADLVLRRTLRFPMGDTSVEIHDEVENLGYERAVLMLLYHVNVGWPVVAEGARLLSPAAEVVGREEASQAAVAEHTDFPPPREGFDQLVYHHRLHDPAAASATISIANAAFGPTAGIALSVTYDPRQLPWLWQWRMLAPGMYLTGLEPANCGIMGRAEERERGTLQEVAPGETRRFDLTIRATLGAGVGDLVRAHDEGGE